MIVIRGSSIAGTVLRGAALSTTVRVAGLALSYVANILLARTLGIDGFGQYSIALSWALVLALPAKAGFDNSALRYSSVYLEAQDYAALRGFIRLATLAVLIVSAIIAVILVAGGKYFVPFGETTRAWTAVLVPAFGLLALYSVILRTARRIVSAQLYEQVLRPALIIGGIAAAAAMRNRLSASSAIALTTLATLAALAGSVLALLRVLRPASAPRAQYDHWREWLIVSVPMLMLGVVQELMNQTDILLLGQLADARQAALFAAAWRLASLVPFALVALATMAGPLIAAAYDQRNAADLHRISSVVARTGFAFALVGAAVLYAARERLLNFFGHDFTAAHEVLAVLLVGGIVNAFTGVVAYFATLTGRERQALAIFAGALTLSIVLNLLLIPRFGAVGAAVASSSATAAWNLAMLVYVRRSIGIDASAIALPMRPRNEGDWRAPLS